MRWDKGPSCPSRLDYRKFFKLCQIVLKFDMFFLSLWAIHTRHPSVTRFSGDIGSTQLAAQYGKKAGNLGYDSCSPFKIFGILRPRSHDCYVVDPPYLSVLVGSLHPNCQWRYQNDKLGSPTFFGRAGKLWTRMEPFLFVDEPICRYH